MSQRRLSWQEGYSTPPREMSSRSRSASVADVAPSSSSPGSRRSPSFIRKLHSIGSTWTVAMTRLQFAGTYFEAAECLRDVANILSDIDNSDRMKFCKSDYDAAIAELRKQRGVWSRDLFKEAVAIVIEFFDTNPFRKLPFAVHQEIILWLPLEDYAQVACVSSEWSKLMGSNEIWMFLYYSKFIANNPGSLPGHLTRTSCFKFAFQERMQDPHIGDKVEVSWKGKFRLETQDVYQGLAWWVAEVVDKHRLHDRYKIHYPGWESRWDEWVPRSRLRWMVRPNTLVGIYPGDIVELWCCGQNVPGTWLECKVKKIRGRRYCLGRVLSSGYLWVDRNRLRLVRRGALYQQKMMNQSGSTRDSSPRVSPSQRSWSTIWSPISSLSSRLHRAVSRMTTLVLANGDEDGGIERMLFMDEDEGEEEAAQQQPAQPQQPQAAPPAVQQVGQQPDQAAAANMMVIQEQDIERPAHCIVM